MKKWFSYLWPISSKRETEHNGTLEISWINGKKLLNSAHTNYSYGSLQKVLEFGLGKINLPKVQNALILGVGGGSVVYSLRNTFGYNQAIVGVEWDKKVLDIGLNDYGLKDFQNAKFVLSTAESFVISSNEKFDLIIVDLFVDIRVPPQFYKIEFWNKLNKILIESGQVLFNAGFFEEDEFRINQLEKQLKERFLVERYDKVISLNTLMKLEKR